MKVFNQKIDLKRILVVVALLLFGNFIKIFVLYKLRTEGDIDFYDYFDHLSVFLFSIVALLSVLVSWRFISQLDRGKSILSLIKIYILSFFIFISSGLLIDYIIWISLSSLAFDLMARFFNMLTVAFVLIDVFALTSAFLYFRESQKTAIELEETEKEKAIIQSQILQKNLEPHFLFNNLSVLSGLAKKNPEQMETFIDDFSDVYRYYLRHAKEPLVDLKEELIFLKNYMGLIGKRFGKAYQVDNKIEKFDGFIIPCSLQLCIENAIKHNKGSEEKPLVISLSRRENCLVIKNNLNKVDFTVGTGMGNRYLERQYQLNFDRKVVFTETDRDFIIEIPLISQI